MLLLLLLNVFIHYLVRVLLNCVFFCIQSLEDKSVYFGKRPAWAAEKFGNDAQWATLLKKGCIENITCFEEQSRTLVGSLRLAKGKEQTISHQFCFASNTGKCGEKSRQPARLNSWRVEDFCPSWMISHPSVLSN